MHVIVRKHPVTHVNCRRQIPKTQPQTEPHREAHAGVERIGIDPRPPDISKNHRTKRLERRQPACLDGALGETEPAHRRALANDLRTRGVVETGRRKRR